MIIDCILDRYDGEKYNDFNYNAHDFYIDILGYGRIGDGITAAMDYGTEDNVKNALCEYIRKNEYNPNIIKYINARTWLENTNEQKPFIDILAEV